MDVSDLPDLGGWQDEQCFLQDCDSILYPPDEHEEMSAAATTSKKRIKVADLWSSTDPSSSSGDRDGEVGVELPELSPRTPSTPSLCLQSLFDVQPPPATAPTAEVALDLSTVFPADRSQVLHWHANRSLLALVQLAQAGVAGRFSRRRLRKKRFSGILVLSSRG